MRILFILFFMFLTSTSFAQTTKQVEFDKERNLIVETTDPPAVVDQYNLNTCFSLLQHQSERLRNLQSELTAVQQYVDDQNKICEDAKTAGLKTTEEIKTDVSVVEPPVVEPVGVVVNP